LIDVVILQPKEEHHQAMMITPELLGLIPTSALSSALNKTGTGYFS